MKHYDLVEIAIAKRKRDYEQKRLELLSRAFSALNLLALRIPFEQAYIFGSASNQYEFDEFSDLDIGFLGLSDEDFFKALVFLCNEIEMDNIDVVQLEEHRLASMIMKEGIPWIRKD